jgi:hypothetical protein
MRYFFVEPEVAGGWGKNTVFERTPGKPPVVHKLHYHFEGWLGDELLESAPCFIATQALSDLIKKAHLTGAEFDTLEVSTAENFQELTPELQLPGFVWLKVHGVAGRDDFGIASDCRLVISKRALDLLQTSNISQAQICEYK